MSRSRKKTPIFNIASQDSQKPEKSKSNRKFRRKEKEILNKLEDLDEDATIPEDLREVSNIYSWGCDGWRYYTDKEDKDMRK